ncbi:uncharacterized protein LOC120340507 [Styela clava]
MGKTYEMEGSSNNGEELKSRRRSSSFSVRSLKSPRSENRSHGRSKNALEHKEIISAEASKTDGDFSEHMRKLKSKHSHGIKHKHPRRKHTVINENDLIDNLKRLTPLYRRKIFFDQLKRYWYIIVIAAVLLTGISVGISLIFLPQSSERLIEVETPPSPLHGRWGVVRMNDMGVESIVQGLKNDNLSVIKIAEDSIKSVYLEAGLPIQKVKIFYFNGSNTQHDRRLATNKNTVVLEHTAFFNESAEVGELDIDAIVRTVRKILSINDTWIFDPNLLSVRQGSNRAVANSVDSFVRSEFPQLDLKSRRGRMGFASKVTLCEVFFNVSNGKVSPDICLVPGRIRTGLACYISCDDNFILTGSKVRTCLSSGAWTGSESRCELPCPHITPPTNGIVDPRWCKMVKAKSTLLLGMSCNFFCSPGYTLIGSFRAVCQSDGTWSSMPPTCKRVCPGAVFPENGHVVPTSCSSNWVKEGTFCSFFCDDGHVIQGKTTATCDSDGSWTTEAPVCKKKCHALQTLHNGKVHPSICGEDKADVGTRCTFSCGESYKLVGSKERSCDVTGQWTGTTSECVRICAKIGQRQYLKMSPECALQTSQAGTQCNMSCVRGFEIDGAEVLTCQDDGLWDKDPPVCRATCIRFEEPKNGYLICSGFSEGASCSLFCPEQYVLFEPSSVVCRTDGAWSEPIGRCVNTCPKYMVPDHAKLHPTKCGLEMSLVGQICYFECNNGYGISGNFKTECLEDGTWSHNTTICVEEQQYLIQIDTSELKMCLILEQETSFLLKIEWVECIRGMQYTKWTVLPSGLIRNVDSNKCLAAEGLGSMSFLVGKSCDETDKLQIWNWPFSSDEGYSLKLKHYDLYPWEGYSSLSKTVITSQITHLKASWKLYDLTASRVSSFYGAFNNGGCPPLKNGQNGRWSPSSCSQITSRIYSYCTFVCSTGFTFRDQDLESQCVNGIWSNAITPNCVAGCRGLHTDSKMSIAPVACHDKYVDQEIICTASCPTNTILVGEKHLVCLKGGIWTFPPPICVPLCNTLVVVGSGSIKSSDKCFDNSGLHRNGSLCEIECAEGFVLSTSSFYRCVNGAWDNDQPVCQRKCNKPTFSSHGSSSCMNGPSFYVEGESCTYTCDTDYAMLTNISTIKCLSSGLWSHNTPVCKRICQGLPIAVGMSLTPSSCSGTGDIVENTICTVSCDAGFILSGSRIRTCLASGSWSGYTSSCVVDRQFFIWNNHDEDKRCLYANKYLLQNTYRLVLKPFHLCVKTDPMFIWKADEDDKLRNVGANLCLGSESIRDNALIILSSCEASRAIRWQYVLRLGRYVILNNNGTHYLRRHDNSHVELDSLFDENFENRSYYGWKATDLDLNEGSVCGIAHNTCPRISLLDGTYFVSSDLHCHSAVDTGSNCTLFCPSGPQIGSPSEGVLFNCLQYGMWSNVNIDCSYKTCRPLTLPSNASINDETCLNTNSSTTGDRVCEISCDEGSVKIATNKLNKGTVCLINGEWSEPAPECLSKCMHVSSPINGSVSRNCNGEQVLLDGDTCEFFCNFDHEIVGNNSIKCVGGEWSGPVPTCALLTTNPPIKCPGLSPPANGYLMPSSCTQGAVAHGTMCSINCNMGYLPDRTIPSSIRCQANGGWTGPENRCLKICNVFDFVSESNRNHQKSKFIMSPERCFEGNNTEGDLCYLDCVDEYDIFAGPYAYGSPLYIKCQRDGEWSLSENEHEKLYKCLKVAEFKIQSRSTGLCINAITPTFVGFTSCDTNDRGVLWVFYHHVLKNRKNLTHCLNIDDSATSLSTLSLAPCSLTDVRQRWDCGVNDLEYEIINYYIGVKLVHINNSNRVFAIKMRNADFSLVSPSFFDPKDGKDEWTNIENEHICGRRTNADVCMIHKWTTIENGAVSPNCQLKHSTIPQYDFISVGEVCSFHCNENYTLVGSSSAKCMWRGRWEYDQDPKCVRMCPALAVPDFATGTNVNCSRHPSMPGSRCEFICDYGFIHSGDLVQLCLPTGTWAGIQPFCYKLCAPIKHRHASTIQPPECTEETQVAGTICSTVCNDGYEIEGKSTQLCQPNGEWSSPQGSCAILCPALSSVIHGIVAPSDCFSSKKMPGSVCIHRCKSGYKLIGGESRTCGANGLWSGKIATCLRKCPKLYPPSNAVYILQSGHENVEGAIIRTICKVDYTVDKNPIRQCLSNGLWSGKKATCVYEKQFLLLQSSPPSPSICLFTDEKLIVRISNIAQCNLKSPWFLWAWHGSNQIRNVGANMCLSASSRDFGNYLILENCIDIENNQKWHCSTFGHKNVISLKNTDAIPVFTSLSPSKVILLSTDIIIFLNKKSIVPLANLQWYAMTSESNHTLLCSAKDADACHGLQPSEHLSITPQCQLTPVPIGTDCSFQCKSGFVPTTDILTSTCLNSGYWSNGVPKCAPACDGLVADKRVRATPENCLYSVSLPEGQTCRFSCPPDYVLVGDHTLTCLNNGKWTSSPPMCKKTCSTLNIPLLGSVVPELCIDLGLRLIEGTECEISCLQHDHILSGSSKRVCTETGEWSGFDSKCIKPCNIVDQPPHSIVGPAHCLRHQSQIGSICSFTCEAGYSPSETYYRRCLENGTWSGEELYCQIYCPVIENVAVDGVIYPSDCLHFDSAPGSMCNIKCDTGYEVIGNKFVSCNSGGTWNGKLGVCTRKCPRLKKPLNGNIKPSVCMNGDIYAGTVCTHSCQEKYLLSGSNLRTCSRQGQWTGTEAKCVPSCPPLGTIKLASVLPVSCTKSSQPVNTKCTVGCVNGTLCADGAKTVSLSCLPNGFWNRPSPKQCLHVCDVYEVENGAVVCENSEENNLGVVFDGEKCTVHCHKFHVPITHPTSTCVMGNWTPFITRCKYIPYPLLMVQRIAFDTKCLGIEESFVTMHSWEACRNESSGTKWAWRNHYSIVNLASGLCLTAVSLAVDESIIVSPCDDHSSLQKWDCDSEEPYSIFLSGTLLGPGRRYPELPEITLQEVGAPESFFYTFNPNSKDELGTLCSVRPHRGCPKLLLSGGVSVSPHICREEIVPPSTVCTLECLNIHHVISGESVFQCDDSGMWMPDIVGECEPRCPPLLPEGKVLFVNESCLSEQAAVGTICEYSCPSGYVLQAASKTRECLKNGEWSGNKRATCKLLCTELKEPKNAKLYPLPCTHGTCTIQCEVGYRLNGPKARVCQGFGEWSGTEFSCVEDVQFAISTKNLALRIAMCLTVISGNQVVKLPCKLRNKSQMWRWRSHHTLENVYSESCLSLRQANFSDDKMLKITGKTETQTVHDAEENTDVSYDFEHFQNSSQPSDVFVTDCNSDHVNQYWECDATSHLNKFRVKLPKLGLFLGSGPQFTTRITLNNNSHPSPRWMVNDYEGISTICSKRLTGVCPPIQPIYGGVITPALCTSEFITSGTKCHFQCDDSYIIEGDQSSICRPSGFWTKDPPVCIGVSKCPPLMVLEPLIVRPSICKDKRISEGKRCFFRCKETYLLSGTEVVLCTANQKWSDRLPTCNVFCATLPPPVHGLVSPESCQNSENDVGKTCSFSCLEGFDIVGEINRTCLSRGTWSGKQTLCRKLCLKLDPIPHGLISPERCMFNKSSASGTCVVTCEIGFWLDGQSRLVCKDGIWSHGLPTCRNNTCHKYLTEVDSIISIKYSKLNNGAIVKGTDMKYECDDGYRVHDNNERTCMSDGSWSGPKTLCTPLKCTSLQRLYHGFVEPESCITSLGVPIGTLCSYSCDHGFALSGASSVECLTTGKWSESDIPQCHDTNTYSHHINFLINEKFHQSNNEKIASNNCIEATKGENKTLFMSNCSPLSPFKLWRWYGSSRIQNVANHLCWELESSGHLVLGKCNLNITAQRVHCGDIHSISASYQISVNMELITHRLQATSNFSATNLDWVAIDSSTSNVEGDLILSESYSQGVPVCTYMCGGTFHDEEGNLATPNFPSSYPGDVLCKWTIIALTKTIYVDFSLVELSNRAEKGNKCFTDNIVIFDGATSDCEQSDILSTVCHRRDNLRVKSLHGVLHIQLTSDHNDKDNGQGFSARWFSEEYPPLYPTCGVSELGPTDFHNTTNHGYPWQVVIVTWKRVCDATFIDKRFVITSAQCVEHIHSAKEVVKLIVAYDFFTQSEFLLKFKRRRFDHADKVWVHPKYQPDMLLNNIAMVRLVQGIQMPEDLLHPICLPSPDVGRVERAGDNCVVSSYKSSLMTKPSQTWRFTKIATARILTREVCDRLLIFERGLSFDSGDLLCTEMFYESDPQLPLMFESKYIDNDGGTVLQCLWNENWYAVGLFNFALSDSKDKHFHVYTEIIANRDWITNTIDNAFLKPSNVFV